MLRELFRKTILHLSGHPSHIFVRAVFPLPAGRVVWFLVIFKSVIALLEADQLDTSLSYHVYIVIFHYSSKHECIVAHTCIPMYPLMMQDARICHFSMLLLYEPHPSYLINIWTPRAIYPLPFVPVLPIGGRTLCSGDGGRARARAHIRGPVAVVGVAPGVIEVVPVLTTVVAAWSGGSSWITWKLTIVIISQ